jgi:seryl-tRNA synthetase
MSKDFGKTGIDPHRYDHGSGSEEAKARRKRERLEYADKAYARRAKQDEELAAVIRERNGLKAKLEEAERECNELRVKLGDWQETYANIVAERCTPDDHQHHCTCVPALRAEIAWLETVREKSTMHLVRASKLEQKLSEAETRERDLERVNSRVEAACAGYREALEGMRNGLYMRMIPRLARESFCDRIDEVLAANPAGAGMLEVWRTSDAMLKCWDTDIATAVDELRTQEVWEKAVRRERGE